ncbi:hypothetical protein [Actinoplanes sp. NPDC049118]|uniref:hypothetical protein n=1 Tax=Actinoplanes sp. NPDC049118 TaxID=3155769 RepID=UPI0033D1D1DF
MPDDIRRDEPAVHGPGPGLATIARDPEAAERVMRAHLTSVIDALSTARIAPPAHYHAGLGID